MRTAILLIVWIFVSCDSDRSGASKRSQLDSVETSVRSGKRAAILPAEDSTLEVENVGRLYISQASFEDAVIVEMQPLDDMSGFHLETLHTAANGATTPVPQKDIEVCIHAFNGLDNKDIQITLDDENKTTSIEVAAQKSPYLCVDTKIITATFQIIEASATSLSSKNIRKTIDTGYLQVTLKNVNIRAHEIEITASDRITGGIQITAPDDATIAQDVRGMELCFLTESGFVPTASQKNDDGTNIHYETEEKGSYSCLSLENPTGLFFLGPPLSTFEVDTTKTTLAQSPVFTIKPAPSGAQVSVYDSVKCDTTPLSTTQQIDQNQPQIMDLSDGVHILYYQTTTQDGAVGLCTKITNYTVDTVAPVIQNFSIDSDASSTSNQNVTLTIEADLATQMYITNTENCTSDGVWEAYATTRTWTLGTQNALATVYIKFRDDAGNETACISDAITHSSLSLTLASTSSLYSSVAATSPLPPLFKDSATYLRLGGQHACVLVDNALKCWGENQYGQLGQGHSNAIENQDDLRPVELSSSNILALSLGYTHTCVLQADNALRCWGNNTYGQLGIHANQHPILGTQENDMGEILQAVHLGHNLYATAIATGHSHTCALLNDQTMKCWGRNQHGQLGQEHKRTLDGHNNDMGDNLPAIKLGNQQNTLAITAGQDHTCALLDNHTVKCWGNNQHGQLGQGHLHNIGETTHSMGDNLPAIKIGSSQFVTAITSGDHHTCALLNNHTVKCWGKNDYGQLGQGHDRSIGGYDNDMGNNLKAIDLGSGRKALRISASGQQTCALLDDHTVKCWGKNSYGQPSQDHLHAIGDMENQMGDFLIPLDTNGEAVIDIQVGGSQACAILQSQRIKCWE